MRYPKLHSWMLFKKLPDGEYSVRDCTSGEKYTLGRTIAYFARRLDGKTDPFTILPGCPRRFVQTMLDDLNEAEFLRYGRLLKGDGNETLFAVVMPKKYRTGSILPALFNSFLLLSWLPVLLYGLYCFCANLPEVNNGSILLGQCAAILLGSVLHEAAHAAATLHYGGRVFEAGILLKYWLPWGAYVLLDDAPVKGRLQKMQIMASGVEMNMLLAGIGAILCVYAPGQSGAFYGFALTNLMLGLLNLSLSDGLDGMGAINKLLGIDAFVERAKYILTHKKERKRLCKAGPHGVAELMICCLILCLQCVIPLIYAICIWKVIACFF